MLPRIGIPNSIPISINGLDQTGNFKPFGVYGIFFSQKDLADRIGLGDSAQLCKLEKGRHLPHTDFLEKIENGLGLPPHSLVSMRNQIAQDGCYDDNALFDDPYERFRPACDELSIPEEKLRTLTSDIQPIVDEYAALLEKLNQSTSCRVNLGTLRASTDEDGIAYAEGLRDLLGDYTASLPALLPRLEQLNFRFGVSSMAMLYRLESIKAIAGERHRKLLDELRRPNACNDASVFVPRPPLVFGTWLKTLRLRAEVN